MNFRFLAVVWLLAALVPFSVAGPFGSWEPSDSTEKATTTITVNGGVLTTPEG